jgi:DNA-binding NarL/FixJ family response regulator
MNDYRIILADDHSILRDGLKLIIHAVQGLKVVGEANNGHELLSLLEKITCDLVIADIVMPEMDGLVALEEIKRRHPLVKVLILSMFSDYSHFSKAKNLGVSAFMAKEDTCTELNRAIEAIRAGKEYYSAKVGTMLAERQIQSMTQASSPSVEILTKREKEVLALIAQGKTNRTISEELCISPHTVENHRGNLLKKLKAKNAVSLIRYALEKRLI